MSLEWKENKLLFKKFRLDILNRLLWYANWTSIRAVTKEGRFLKRLIVVDLTLNLELLKKSKHQTKKTATTPTMNLVLLHMWYNCNFRLLSQSRISERNGNHFQVFQIILKNFLGNIHWETELTIIIFAFNRDTVLKNSGDLKSSLAFWTSRVYYLK